MTDTNTPEEGWRPIETAPRDGTPVLVYGWRDPAFRGVVARYPLGGSHWVVTWNGDALRGEEAPTHWMPLPPSPAEQAPSLAAAKRGALPGQLREAKSSSEPALSELVERLTKWAEITACEDPFLAGSEDAHKTLYGEAAQSLTALQAQMVTMRAALEPFAATGAVLDPKPKDTAVWAGQTPAPPITFGHLRAAALAAPTNERPKTGGSEP
jgi:hypothetical protein